MGVWETDSTTVTSIKTSNWTKNQFGPNWKILYDKQLHWITEKKKTNILAENIYNVCKTKDS